MLVFRAMVVNKEENCDQSKGSLARQRNPPVSNASNESTLR